MSGGGGGGASIIAAYAVIRNFIRSGRATNHSDQRAKLDDEELREVEYASMGLAVPDPRPRHRRAPGSCPVSAGAGEGT